MTGTGRITAAKTGVSRCRASPAAGWTRSPVRPGTAVHLVLRPSRQDVALAPVRHVLEAVGLDERIERRLLGPLRDNEILVLGMDIAIEMSVAVAGHLCHDPQHLREDCDELVGDSINRKVTWNGNANLSALSGKTIRLRFILKDADLFAFRFVPLEESDFAARGKTE